MKHAGAHSHAWLVATGGIVAGVSYGWSFGALYGPWLAALAVGGLAAGLWLEAPGLWPLTALLVVQAAAFFVGGVLMRASKRRDWATLPLVPLLRKPGSRVLADGSVDAAVSAHAIDHLGPAKQKGVEEVYRVLAPGGRFLLVVWVPGWAMLTIASVASLLLTPKSGWRAMADRAGFRRLDEGLVNGAWFLLLEKPGME